MQPQEWLTTTLHPLLNGDTQTIVHTQAILFSADTDQTQSYVFESNNLPEIRGASRQIAELSERTTILKYLNDLNLFEQCLLFAGGGSILAVLPSLDMAKQLEQRLIQAYAEETTVVSITCNYSEFDTSQLSGFTKVKLPPSYSQSAQNSFFGTQEDIESSNFGRAIYVAAFKLRRKKQQKSSIPFVQIASFSQICESCEVRPSSTKGRGGDLICDVCKRKANAPDQRRYWFEQLKDQFAASGIDVAKMQYPQDIKELTNGQPVSLIYADGDAIGEKLQQLKTASEYKTFSGALTASTYHAVCEAIQSTGLNTSGKCNWEIVTVGGDDVLILLPAKYALHFAINLSTEFTNQMSHYEFPNMSMCVGFTIGKVKTPIQLLYEGAKSSLTRAKTQAKDVDQACVDWHNTITEGHPSSSRQHLRTTQFSSAELMTGRPYTLEASKLLLNSINKLRGQGLNSQLYNIVTELGQSAARGSLYYYYQRARLKDERQSLLKDLEDTWKSNSFPWITRENDQYTMMLDILDLL